MQMWKLKGCPRCGGDVFTSFDNSCGYEQCLQCAWERELTLTGVTATRDEVKKLSTYSRGPYRVRRAPMKAGKG